MAKELLFVAGFLICAGLAYFFGQKQSENALGQWIPMGIFFVLALCILMLLMEPSCEISSYSGKFCKLLKP